MTAKTNTVFSLFSFKVGNDRRTRGDARVIRVIRIIIKLLGAFINIEEMPLIRKWPVNRCHCDGVTDPRLREDGSHL